MLLVTGSTFCSVEKILLFTILLIFSDLTLGQEHSKDNLKLHLFGWQEKNRAAILVKLVNITVLNGPDQAYAYAMEADQTARRQNQLPLLSDALKFKADALFYLDSLLPSLDSYLESV